MTIQIQMGVELDPFGGAVALALGCATGAGAAEVAGADEVTDGGGELVLAWAEELAVVGGGVAVVGEELAVRLETALLTLLPTLVPHAVARLRTVSSRQEAAFSSAAAYLVLSLAGDARHGTSVPCAQPGPFLLSPRHPRRMNRARTAPAQNAARRDDDHRGVPPPTPRRETSVMISPGRVRVKARKRGLLRCPMRRCRVGRPGALLYGDPARHRPGRRAVEQGRGRRAPPPAGERNLSD